MDFLKILFNTEGTGRRTLSGFPKYISAALGILLTLIVFYTAFCGVFPPLIQNSLALCVLLSLSFLRIPAAKSSPKDRPSLIDYILSAASLVILAWTLYSASRFDMRIPLVSHVLPADKICGTILVFLAIESCRRTSGTIITLIAVLAIVYAFMGPHLNSVFKHPGFTYNKFIDIMYLTSEGLFGSLTAMVATVLFGFISFGVVLAATGGDKYFMDVALALAGKLPGGPAKVSILGSSLMGMISGSTIANIVTTGSVTIPMIKKIGYSPEEAGAVEACASSGGQIMPPVMGAGAFLMADYLGVSFFDVALLAFAPALLYYAGLWFFNDKIAKKRGLKGLDSVPSVKESLKQSIHMWIPIILLMIMCCMKYSPFFSGVICTCLVFVCAVIKERSLRLVKKLPEILANCSGALISIVGIIGVASIIVAIISYTGLMVKSTSIILGFSGGSTVLTVLILWVVSYVMGMGLPVTSCYVILAALGVPALVKCGATPVGAHFMLFWCSMLAGITPPVCIAAYVAANVAGAEPMKTGFNSLKMGSMFYIVPISFLGSNILTGKVFEILAVSAVLLAAIYFYVVAVEGHMLSKTNILERVSAAGLSLCLYAGAMNLFDLKTRAALIAAGLAVGVFMLVRQRKAARSAV